MIKILFVCHGKVSPERQRTSIYNGFSNLSRWISHTFPTIMSLWHSTNDFPLTAVGGIFNEKLNVVRNDRVQIPARSKKHPDIFHTVVGRISLIILVKLFSGYNTVRNLLCNLVKYELPKCSWLNCEIINEKDNKTSIILK